MSIRWGILGAGNIAHRFARSVAKEPHSVLVGFSCRTRQKARQFAEEFSVPAEHVYTGPQAHQNLLDDPQIDAIYLALPHSMHHEWAIAAMRAGKAALCEKPAALDEEQMRDIAKVSRQTGMLFMEGMKTRFVPLYARVKGAVDDGIIGEVTSIDATLCNDMAAQIEAAGSYHVQPVGGGVLLDCGCYCATWIEDYLSGGIDHLNVDGLQKNGVDYYVDAQFEVGGNQARLECAFDRKKPRRCTIHGTRGTIVVDELHRPQEATVTLNGQEPHHISEPYVVDDFYGEIAHFSHLWRHGHTESPVMPLAASIRQARILDSIRQAFRYTPDSLATLQRQEDILRYPARFGSDEALRLGNAVADLSSDYGRGVLVQIVREKDGLTLFQWASDDKAPRNLEFAQTKRQASLTCGHSSLWGYVRRTLDGVKPASRDEVTGALYSAGAFPIVDGTGQRVATVSISGLHEGRDHELAVRALERALGVVAPTFTEVAV